MCKCTPYIRTPFCGKPGCEWPEPEQRRSTVAQDARERQLLLERVDYLRETIGGLNVQCREKDAEIAKLKRMIEGANLGEFLALAYDGTLHLNSQGIPHLFQEKGSSAKSIFGGFDVIRVQVRAMPAKENVSG